MTATASADDLLTIGRDDSHEDQQKTFNKGSDLR
jgi:hypothetical protein